MSNPLHPAVKLTLDGTTYLLRFDFEAIAEAEEITDRSLLTGLHNKDITQPRISFVRAMFFAALHPDQPQMAYEEAKKLVNRESIVPIWSKVLEAWTAGLAEPDPEEAPADPNVPSQS